MQKAINQEVHVDFKIILTHTVVDKVTVMVQPVNAFLTVSAVVVPWRLGRPAYLALLDALRLLLSSQNQSLLGLFDRHTVVGGLLCIAERDSKVC